MTPDTHLILWSCGPVQDFIASARKGRDLWFGSWLLSELARAAARSLVHAGGRLILPAPTDLAELDRPDFDVPNRILCEIDTVDPGAVAAAASRAARERLLAMAREVFDRLDAKRFDRGPALQQLEDLLETAWAAVRSTGDDRRDRRRVDALLAARKTCRTFSEPAFAAWGVPKSSLDGQREAVTKRDAGLSLGLGPQERLCGVGLFKRKGHEAAPKDAPGGRVASVSEFAALAWLRPALDAEGGVAAVERAVRDYHRELEALGSLAGLDKPEGPVFGRLDAHALYPGRIAEFLTTASNARDAEKAVREAHGRLRERLEVDGVRLTRSPNPYYAILLGDGDRMGALLDQLDHDGTREVSAALSEFARDVRDRVFAPARLEGACVYAGGDDVLALVPVDVALEKARELAEAFQRKLGPVAAKHGQEAPTFSVGLCVTHHLSPLRDGLDGAREAERIAKERAGRNAWAVRLLKRSGAPQDLWGSWADHSDERLRTLMAWSRPGKGIPRGLAHDLLVAARHIDPSDDDRKRPENTRHLEWCEFRRVIRQKRLTSDDAAGPGDEGGGAIERILSEELRHSGRRGLREVADRLVMARALTGLGEAE